ncbi:MAG: DNA mismatch repair endonuclease MutL [Candidatus Delongbacteria bacterium]|nr:DNA mismatch repair endonuclease MutL [Candidatus Delongbacteria bacterium]
MAESETRDQHPRIRLLSSDLCNKIAAGEVIERPYSVVKELIENSVDAMADRISISVDKGGKELIEISDNGHGIPKDDIRLAFQRHATSKISEFDDLNHLRSMGFRGEALPSIASVSQVEVWTRYFQEDSAIYLRLEAGKEMAYQETARDVGSTIRIRNLFFNVPARRKFLRQDNTEYRYILTEVENQALAHPQISWRCISNGQEVFHYPQTPSLEQRIYQVLGHELEGALLPIEYRSDLGSIRGYAGSIEVARKSASIYSFVNQRIIRDKVITKAILEVYRSMLEKDRYPLVFIYLDLDPGLVDFNVHPSKREVRFNDSLQLYHLVYTSVKKALDQGFSKDHALMNLSSSMPRSSFAKPQISFQETLPLQLEKKESKPISSPPEISKVIQRITHGFETEQNNQTVQQLWQLHQTYIVTSIKDGMVVIDQHAAAERVLYEKILKSFRDHETASQQLLFPEVINLNQQEFALYQEVRGIFETLGFSLREYSGHSLMIESIPAYIQHWESASTFKEIMDDLIAEKEIHTKAVEKIARYTACRTAVKAGDKLNVESMQQIIDDLFACEFPYTCPHGRPTLIKINLSELEKRFGRK